MNLNRRLEEQIRDLLEGLGGSRAAVAVALHQFGVRAVPGDPHDCAVAVYLKAVLGADSRIQALAVGSRCLKTVTGRSALLHRLVLVPLPEPIREFIEVFDAEVYPALLRATSAEIVRHSERTGE